MSLSWLLVIGLILLGVVVLWLLKPRAAALFRMRGKGRDGPKGPMGIKLGSVRLPEPPDLTNLFKGLEQSAPTAVPMLRLSPSPANAASWTEVTVSFATDRRATGSTNPSEFFSGQRNSTGELSYGVCSVSIPRDHRLGTLESPSFVKLQFRPDPEKHVVLLKLVPETKEGFFADISQRVEQSGCDELFVFVHGYNVSFEDASRRTAQIAYDLGFSGVPVLYSWPSEGEPHLYPVDEANAEWSIQHFKSFLKDITELAGAGTVHIIGHSMGNRLITAALHQLNAEQFAPPARFRQVILAAPDLDAGTLRQLAQAIKGTAERITLYASAGDRALLLSRQFHHYPRAGEVVFPIDGIDVIDASAVDTGLIGHSYYGDNRSVLSDLFWLLRNGAPPSERFGMSVQAGPDGTYFAFMA